MTGCADRFSLITASSKAKPALQKGIGVEAQTCQDECELRLSFAVLPAVFVLVLTIIISLSAGHPNGLFLTRSTTGMIPRFLLVTLIMLATIPALPRFLVLAGRVGTHEGVFGQLVKGADVTSLKFNKIDLWVIRPFQGIALALLFAERFLSLLEFTTGVPYTVLITRLILFFLGGALTALLLSLIWGLDDLGVRIYNRKTGEIRLAGTTIGTVLPLIAAAIGISGLVSVRSPTDALAYLLEIVMVLYPPYALFAVFHREFVLRRENTLTKKISLQRIEAKLLEKHP